MKKTVIYKDMSKEQLIDKVIALKRMNTNREYMTNIKVAEIRSMRSRLVRIRDEIDYLLEHPWGVKINYIKMRKGRKKWQ